MTQAVQSFKDQLHLSHSQLFTYLNCSLKYWFAYVSQTQKAHTNIALHFGKAVHKALEVYYLAIQQTPIDNFIMDKNLITSGQGMYLSYATSLKYRIFP